MYQPRIIDGLLADIVSSLPAVAIEGAKGVGKTATAQRLAASVVQLDQSNVQANVAADARVILPLAPPVLIDEWQLVPGVWDMVRREVDRQDPRTRFILTGSATPAQDARLHSGAGRILRLTMRPMSLAERGVATPTVSLTELLNGTHPDVEGRSDLGLMEYTREILRSGFPGLRVVPDKFLPRSIDAYLDTVLEHDIPKLGVSVRRPHALRAWLAAYGAATSTTARYNVILDAATPGEGDKPSGETGAVYRELLQRLWLVDPLPAWSPVLNPLARLAQTPKHHLVDPALAARLLGASERSLIDDSTPQPIPRQGTLLGALFESLVAQSVRVFAEPLGVRVSHLRTRNGDHEIDLIVERDDNKVLAVEVKLAGAVTSRDATHLNWLSRQIGDNLVDKVIINTGPFAHRLPDGTAVVPLALLGI